MEKEDTQPPSQTSISEKEVSSLLNKIKTAMKKKGISEAIVKDTTIIVIHPECWEISLLVPSKNTHTCSIKKIIEDILYRVCGVEEKCCDYLGKQMSKVSYEWYFRHPNTPRDIYERLEQQIEEELGGVKTLPKPQHTKPSDSPAFVTVTDEVFEQIQSGKKNIEYRKINQYYCNKFFSAGKQKKFIKFNRGYRAGKNNQMLFEIESIVFVNRQGEELSLFKNGKLIDSSKDIPPTFNPIVYGIKLGKRIT